MDETNQSRSQGPDSEREPTGPVTRLPRHHDLGPRGETFVRSTTIRIGPGIHSSPWKRALYFVFSLAVFGAVLASAIFLTGVFLIAALIISIPLALLGLVRSSTPRGQ